MPPTGARGGWTAPGLAGVVADHRRGRPDDLATARGERTCEHLAHRPPAHATVELDAPQRVLRRVHAAPARRPPPLVLAPHRVDPPGGLDRDAFELAAGIVDPEGEDLAGVAADPDVVHRTHGNDRRVARGGDVLDRLVD